MKNLIFLCGVFVNLLAAHGADFGVQVTKGQRFSQTGSAPPVAAANPFYFEAAVAGVAAFEPVTNPQVTLPDGSVRAAVKLAEGSYGLTQSFATQAALEAAFPQGRYSFSASVNALGTVKGHATLTAGAYPPAPQALNFAEAQTIPANSSFTLRWNAFAGAGASDTINLIITDALTGSTITSVTDLDPTTTEWAFDSSQFPGNRSLQAALTFFKKGDIGFPDNGELLTGRVIWSSETVFPMKTTDGSTSIDTTPPTLTSVIPSNGARMSNTFDVVLFQFNENMDTTKTGVQWEATLNGQPFALDLSKLTYLWGDPKNLVCTYRTTAISGWPAGVSVFWKLNSQAGAPGNLRDTAGNELGTQSGTFTTAGGADPCNSTSAGGLPNTAFFFSKQVNYLQGSADAPSQDPDKGAQAFAFCDLQSAALAMDVVTLKVPTANPFQFKLKALSVPNGATGLNIRLLSESFSARSDLDDAYPDGTYQMEIRDNQVVVINSVDLTVSSTKYPPIPHFSSFSAAQSVNANTDFSLGWDAFAGATTNTENVTLNIYDSSDNLVFQAPNDCQGIKLSPDASGILIPAKTLTNGQAYTAELSFVRLSDRDKTLGKLSGFGFASLARITRMPINASGGVVTAAKFTKFSFTQGSGLHLELTCTPGHILILEQASKFGLAFSPIVTTNPVGGTLSLTLPLTGDLGIFRARNP